MDHLQDQLVIYQNTEGASMSMFKNFIISPERRVSAVNGEELIKHRTEQTEVDQTLRSCQAEVSAVQKGRLENHMVTTYAEVTGTTAETGEEQVGCRETHKSTIVREVSWSHVH